MPDLTLTSAVDTFLGSADQAAMRTNLGLGTMATQAASAVAITGGSISGITAFESSDADFAVDANGNVTAKYFKLANSGANQTSLFLAAVTGVVPSTPSAFSEVIRLAGGAVYISPAGTGTVISGALYLGSTDTVLLGGTNAVTIGNAGSSPSDQCFKGPNGSGTNIVGGKLSIAPGQSTGNETPAILAFQSTAPGSGGSMEQTLVDVFSIVNSQSILVASGVIIDGTGSGFRFGSSTASLLGFWGAAPVSQFNTSAGAGISSAGSGTSVNDDSTFVGSTGSTAYTVNDLISALKLCGVLAA